MRFCILPQEGITHTASRCTDRETIFSGGDEMECFVIGGIVAYAILRIYLKIEEIQAINDLREAVDDYNCKTCHTNRRPRKATEG